MFCIIITGPTGSGKSRLANNIAKYYPSYIINADSQQVLKELPILTDQPTELNEPTHLLYGYKTYQDYYSSFQWCLDCQNCIQKAYNDKKIPIIVGGTGFYIRNLIEGSIDNPITHSDINMCNNEMYKLIINNDPRSKIHPNDTYRLKRAVSRLSFHQRIEQRISFLNNTDVYKILVNPDKDILKEMCHKRINSMFPSVIDEVMISPNHPRLNRVIGFKEIIHNIPKVQDEILIKTMQYIKRQKTWFKKYYQTCHTYTSHDDQKIISDLNSYISNSIKC